MSIMEHHWKVCFNIIETAVVLLSHGANINEKVKDDQTPLHIAVKIIV